MEKQESQGVMLFSAALLAGAALCATAARAEYRCDPPKTNIDDTACRKAAEGPAALRHYIARMRPIESLYFFDYVNEERLVAWREMEDKGDRTVVSQKEQQSN